MLVYKLAKNKTFFIYAHKNNTNDTSLLSTRNFGIFL